MKLLLFFISSVIAFLLIYLKLFVSMMGIISAYTSCICDVEAWDFIMYLVNYEIQNIGFVSAEDL